MRPEERGQARIIALLLRNGRKKKHSANFLYAEKSQAPTFCGIDCGIEQPASRAAKNSPFTHSSLLGSREGTSTCNQPFFSF